MNMHIHWVNYLWPTEPHCRLAEMPVSAGNHLKTALFFMSENDYNLPWTITIFPDWYTLSFSRSMNAHNYIAGSWESNFLVKSSMEFKSPSHSSNLCRPSAVYWRSCMEMHTSHNDLVLFVHSQLNYYETPVVQSLTMTAGGFGVYNDPACWGIPNSRSKKYQNKP